MAGNRNSGRKPKPIEKHLRDGTYRHSVHSHRLVELDKLDIKPKPAGKVRASKKSQRRWIRSEADEIAFHNGCRFNEALAEHVAYFFRTFLCFSKGTDAGEPFELTEWQREELIWPLFGWVRPDGTRRFRRSYIEIPKKNYKSTTASGIGLYMLVGDEEPGAEVYSSGSDKDQARVVHNEAIHMVEASDELARVLDINRTTSAISYDETKSSYKALSGSKKGKHGLNIHCCIADELHEWRGTEVWDAIKYGYRARRQPLQLVITNAGDNRKSVCYQQREKAQKVLDGKLRDDQFFAMILSVPGDEAEAEIEAVKNGATELPIARKCNPALGHVLQESDLVADIRDVIETPSEKSNLLRLTYGVWASGTSKPLLDTAAWERCARAFTIDEFYGEHAVSALDLGETDDMSALVLMFRNAGSYWTLPWFWLPEASLTGHENSEMYRQWHADGFLEITPGERTDYAFIKAKYRELVQEFDVNTLVYDPRSADKLTQEIAEGQVDHRGHVIEHGTGVERYKFAQTIDNYAEATKEFERLIMREQVHHDGNPILSWMAGHCSYRSDPFGNKMPQKPGSKDDARKIDGIQAAIMALAMWMIGEEVDAPSVYEERGVLTL